MFLKALKEFMVKHAQLRIYMMAWILKKKYGNLLRRVSIVSYVCDISFSKFFINLSPY